MQLGRTGRAALRELARRRPVPIDEAGDAAELARLAAEAAAKLRAIYYPRQAAFFAPGGKKWRATRKTRRAGITTAGCRELLARAIEIQNFRATVVHTTIGEARKRAWLSDTKQGLLDVLRRDGERVEHPTLAEAYRLGGVQIDVRDSDSSLVFSNGSEVELFGVENVRAQRKKRGGAKHVVWIDEAQDFFELEKFFDEVVLAMLSDFGGECWLTGTPGIDCAGMFYEITKECEDGEEPLPGWDVHELAQINNPFFGHVVEERDDDDGAVEYYVEDNLGERTGPYADLNEADQAAVDVRWERTAGQAKRDKGWTGEEPAFKRELLGKWVKADARYVYPVHSVPKHKLIFAPQRLADNPFVGTHPRFDGHPRWYDHHAAVRDLPRLDHNRRPHQWLYSLWFDFGYHPDPFAIVMLAFTPTLPDVFEMFSWKQTRVHTDDQGAYIKLLWEVESAIVSFGGDPAGKQDDFEVWKTRMNLPLSEASKAGKNTLEEFLADDIRRERVHLRDGSPLHLEMKNLVYLPSKPGKPREVHKHRKVNGVVHGDHCCDAARYAYKDLTHYLAKLPQDNPAPGTPAARRIEETREERRIDQIEERRAAALADGDELVAEYGGYQW